MIITNLKILEQIPFNADDNKVITFDSAQEQYNYFSSHSIKDFNDVMFVKGFLYKKIKLDVAYDDIKYCNYIMFINRQFNDTQWTYAYIKNFEYISDSCTYIEIEIDYFQTYMAEIVFAPSDIERQMIFDDTQLNSEEMFIDEPELALNNYVITGEDKKIYTRWFVCVCYKSNTIIDSAEDTLNIIAQAFAGNSKYKYVDFTLGDRATYFNHGGAIPEKYITGCSYKIYDIINEGDYTALATDLTILETLGYSIVNIYMVPYAFEDLQDPTDSFNLQNTINPYYTDKKIKISENYQYIPVNNKCYTTPYIYLEITNLQGQFKKYSYQYFLPTSSNPTPQFSFKIYGCFLSRFDAVCFPIQYKNAGASGQGITENSLYDYGISIGETPECQWNSSMSNALRGAAKTLFNVIADTAMMSAGLPPTNTGSPAEEKAQTQKQIRGAGGIAGTIFNNTDNSTKGVPAMPILQVINNKLGWVARQYATVNIIEIDQYFSMYGYRMSKLDRLNILSRRRFNYVKCNNAVILGRITIEARNYIKRKLEEGITFWHDKTNYSYGNFRGQYANDVINKDLVNGKIFQA